MEEFGAESWETLCSACIPDRADEVLQSMKVYAKYLREEHGVVGPEAHAILGQCFDRMRLSFKLDSALVAEALAICVEALCVDGRFDEALERAKEYQGRCSFHRYRILGRAIDRLVPFVLSKAGHHADAVEKLEFAVDLYGYEDDDDFCLLSCDVYREAGDIAAAIRHGEALLSRIEGAPREKITCVMESCRQCYEVAGIPPSAQYGRAVEILHGKTEEAIEEELDRLKTRMSDAAAARPARPALQYRWVREGEMSEPAAYTWRSRMARLLEQPLAPGNNLDAERGQELVAFCQKWFGPLDMYTLDARILYGHALVRAGREEDALEQGRIVADDILGKVRADDSHEVERGYRQAAQLFRAAGRPEEGGQLDIVVYWSGGPSAACVMCEKTLPFLRQVACINRGCDITLCTDCMLKDPGNCPRCKLPSPWAFLRAELE